MQTKSPFRFGLALLAAAIFVVTSARAEVLINDDIDFTGARIYIPCANGGNGEIAVFVGDLHVVITETIARNKVIRNYHFQPQGLIAVGLTTGEVYHATGETRRTDQFDPSTGVVTEVYVNNFRIIGPGPGNNFLVHDNMRFVFDGASVYVLHEHSTADCK
jgi:hypothetical protein